MGLFYFICVVNEIFLLTAEGAEGAEEEKERFFSFY